MTDQTVLTAVATGLPTIVIGVVGYLLSNLIGDLKASLSKLGTAVDEMRKDMTKASNEAAELRAEVKECTRRLDRLESELFTIRKEA